MGNVKIKLNSAGIREMLKSEAISEACKEQADKIKQAAGEGFEVQKRKYPERSGYAVSAESKEAIRKVYSDNVLLKAMGGAK